MHGLVHGLVHHVGVFKCGVILPGFGVKGRWMIGELELGHWGGGGGG